MQGVVPAELRLELEVLQHMIVTILAAPTGHERWFNALGFVQ